MSYTFSWDKPASDVYVTGTFDEWSKSVKLDRDGDFFKKTVSLPGSAEKVYYKFVVDGEWTTSDHSDAKTEADPMGIINNYLTPEDIKPADDSQSQKDPTISSVAPGASTAAMAGEQPLEKEISQPAPGAFPETPANEDQTFSVNPIPASEGDGNPVQLAPGEKMPEQSTFNSNTVDSGVHDDPELKSKDEEGEQTMSVNPIPASGGMGNPMQLAPGEKVPDSREVTGNTVDSTAKMDQASYEKSDAGIQPVQPDPKTDPVAAGLGSTADSTAKTDEASYEKPDVSIQPVQPNPQTDPVAAGLGPQTSSQIPESSMGMGEDAPSDINKENTGPMISSIAPASSTAAMAGQVPKEERREATVIEEDKLDPLKTGPLISSAAPGSSTADMAGQVPMEERREATVIDDNKEAENAGPMISSAAPGSSTAEMAGQQPMEERREPTVIDDAQPEEKKESGNRGFIGMFSSAIAGGGAMAAGGAYAAHEMGKDKTSTGTESAVPESSIPQQTAVGEAPKVPTEEPSQPAVSSVPEEVTQSQKEAQFDPEAAANSEAVDEKAAVEDELLKKVPESEATGEPAPTASAAAIGEPAPTASAVSAVPEEVTQSQKEAQFDPEAAANSEAVEEKAAVEDELLKKVPESEATGEPAPTASAATATTVPVATATTVPVATSEGTATVPAAATETATSTSGPPQLGDPTAGVAALSMDDKAKAAETKPDIAETAAPAEVKEAPVEEEKQMDSRDVSPMSRPGTHRQTQPEAVSSAAATSAAPTEFAPTPRPAKDTANSTPAKRQSFADRMKGTPSSSKSGETTDSKKEKRKSFFGRIKEKLKN